jgi:hypothetical protein
MAVHRRAITTNVKFTYADQGGYLRGLTKYLQYRDDKEGRTHVPQWDEDGKRVPRWTDRGLGDSHRSILSNAGQLTTSGLKREVGARLLVVAPEVELMHAIAENRRADVLRELTESTVEGWFDKMNLATPAYAFVLHESQPSNERPDGRLKDEAQDKSYLHTHVVLAATVPGVESERQNYLVYERHIRQLHEAGREALEVIWTREIGQERLAELNADLERRDERQRELDRQQTQREAEQFFGITPEPETAAPEISPPIDRDLGLELDR